MDGEGKKLEMPRAAWLLAASIIAGAVPAAATDSAWAVLAKAGLSGIWAPSCASPVSSNNRRHIYYGDASDQPRRRIDSGPSGELTSLLEAVSVPSPGLVRFKALRDAALGGVSDRDHRQPASPSAADDASRRRFVVKDGVIVPSGKTSPFFEKCGGPNA